MIDYKKAAEDKVLGWFWNEDEEDAVLGLLVDYYNNKQVRFYRSCKKNYSESFSYKYFSFHNPEDKAKYTIEGEFRPCQTWEEFRPFMGKIAKRKDGDHYTIVDFLDFDKESLMNYEAWFRDYELEDGSPIGVSYVK